MNVNGSIQGIKRSLLAELDSIYELTIPENELVTRELSDKLAYLTNEINREISVLIDNKGKIADVSVGDYNTVSLPEFSDRHQKPSVMRCIHTHPSGDPMVSGVDISSLKFLSLGAMVAIGVKEGKAIAVSAAVLDEDARIEIFGPVSIEEPDLKLVIRRIKDRDMSFRNQLYDTVIKRERAVLVGIETPDSFMVGSRSEAEISLGELGELASTAGAEVVYSELQKRNKKDAAYLLGKGKIEELKLITQSLEADLLVIDEELSGAQIRNIENALGIKVLDRTGLILDIFAQRARSREGKIQVELAQLNYLLPRLTGQGIALSRLGGGIGTRGPGETKLETDRRHIRRKIDYLKEQLERVKKQRGILNKNRKKSGVPVFALVGYTNSGKSTLLNRLCDADVLAEDKLFATLDTTTRKLELDNGAEILVTDTVGFIRNLPHNLIEAFKATLEEAVEADYILNVVDISDPNAQDHIRVTEKVLSDLGACGKKTVYILNKQDKIPEPVHIQVQGEYTVGISALTGERIDDLKKIMEELIMEGSVKVKLKIPYDEGWVLPFLHERGGVDTVDYLDQINVEAVIKKEDLERVRKYVEDK